MPGATSGGVTLQVRPTGRPARPVGGAGTPGSWPGLPGWRWPGRGSLRAAVRGHGRVRVSRWALAGVLLALVLAAGGVTATVAAAPAAPSPPSLACAPAGAAGGLTAEQRENATRIVAVGRAMGISERGQIVAVATAMQESSLVNNPGGDRDSAGLFQQRPSQGWGSYAQVTDPEYAARTFYDRLRGVPGWERMAVTKAAQTVQRSGFPSAYAKWESPAAALVTGTTCQTR